MTCAYDTQSRSIEILRSFGEVLMNDEEQEKLAVYGGGVVGWAHAAPVPISSPAKERPHGPGREAPGGPATGERQRTASREGAADPRSPIIGIGGVERELATRLEELAVEYPRIKCRPAPRSVWILTPVQPVPGLRTALIVSVLSSEFSNPPWVKSWAWWGNGIWIGPRHTNYPNGSICAFEESDGSWNRAESLVPLWDLYSLWLLRHLHFAQFGYWPGKQVLHTAYERIQEQHADELCGGCTSGRRYRECHRSQDQKMDPIRRLSVAARNRVLGTRRVPKPIIEFIFKGCRVPAVAEID